MKYEVVYNNERGIHSKTINHVMWVHTEQDWIRLKDSNNRLLFAVPTIRVISLQQLSSNDLPEQLEGSE
ncbi:hypothetical protein AAGS61_08580 [Lysinibacillus sp. KU-BSD001]|uniref:hypothetical protein n=1 Tax=Lysinibacillus sp. KU-BSD001 TaxID=3141328 RepID=UPI0036E4329D